MLLITQDYTKLSLLRICTITFRVFVLSGESDYLFIFLYSREITCLLNHIYKTFELLIILLFSALMF